MTEKPGENSEFFTFKKLLPAILLCGLLSLAGYFLAYLIGEGLKLLVKFILWVIVPH